MKKILIISFRDLYRGVRARRQMEHLTSRYEVHVLGYTPPQFDNVNYHSVSPRFKEMNVFQKFYIGMLLAFSFYKAAYHKLYDYRTALKVLSKIKFDLIIVHDLFPLPATYEIDPSPNILLDAHEYYFDQGKESLAVKIVWGFKKHLLVKYFLNLQHYITVCEGIAEAFCKKTGKKFEVITNAHRFVDLTPSPVTDNSFRLIHHGYAEESRKIELMIELSDYLDERFTLDLMLTTITFENRYLQRLENMAEERKNVKIIPPVNPEEIVPYTNQYDIGLFLLPPTYFTHKYALPNKFFEFIQARLCIAIGPSVEMTKITKQYNLGIVAEDFKSETLAKAINSLTKEQIEFYKNQSHKHAHELSSEMEMKKIENIIERITSANDPIV